MKTFLLLFLLSLPAIAQLTFVGGCAANATSCTPTGSFAAGHIQYTFAYRNAVTAPTLPAAFTGLDTASANSSSFRSGCLVLTNSTPDSSAWTNASSVVSLVYSGTAATATANCVTSGVGFHTASGTSGTGTTVTYTGGTLTHTDGSSIVIGANGDSTTACHPASGWTSEKTAALIDGGDTGALVSSFSSKTCTGSGNWKTDVVELLAPTVATPSVDTNGGTFGTSASTTLSDNTSGSTICYTTDGSAPSAATLGACSAGSAYSSALTITNSGTTVKALGTKSGLSNSAIATSSAFTVNPFLPSLASLGVSGRQLIITLDASCSGSGTANYIPCSSPMTVTAGDAITCKVTGVSGGQNLTGDVVDAVNGWYDTVYGSVSPVTSTSWETTAVFQNSAAGSITPVLHYNLVPSTRATINCKAWIGVATSNMLDPGPVEQSTSATVTNPTSGTAAAPTYDNELVWAVMSRSNITAPSSGGGCWLPVGILTLVGSSSVRQADEYCIQSTATTVNGPFTGNTTSVATVDSQLALLPLGRSGGTRALTGWFLPLGATGSAPTGTATAATLGGSTSFLASENMNIASPFWAEQGVTAKSYDTGVNPTATGHIMAQGVDHTWGDAGSSIKFAGGTAVGNGFSLQGKWADTGQGVWLWSFYRLSSTGITNNTFCDMIDIKGGVTTFELTFQPKYLTASGLNVVLEATDASANSIIAPFGSLLDTDLRAGVHIASVNERYHQLVLQTKSGAVWSQTGSTMNFDVLCTNGGSGTCPNPPAAVATTTGTASSGSTALTVASGTGIVLGQVVTGTGIPDPSQAGHPAWTVVAAVSGTSVTLSQNTSASLSGTTVNFYTVPHNIAAATNCSVTGGSTAMTCVTPGTGTIAAGQSVGGSGILAGTVVSAVSLPSVTLSIPAQATMTNAGASFWTATSSSRAVTIGKEASCTIAADQWLSGLAVDEAAIGSFNSPN